MLRLFQCCVCCCFIQTPLLVFLVQRAAQHFDVLSCDEFVVLIDKDELVVGYNVLSDLPLWAFVLLWSLWICVVHLLVRLAVLHVAQQVEERC